MPPTTFDYHAFITELKGYIAQAETMSPDMQSHDSAMFKQWKHEVTDLVERIRRKKYSINTKVAHRWFMSHERASKAQNQQEFSGDMQETLVELRFVVAQYEKYGDPQEQAAPLIGPIVPPAIDAATPARSPLEFPGKDKVTAKWMFDHLPAGIWAGGAVVLAGAFALGMGFQKVIEAPSAPLAPTVSAPAPAPAPAPSPSPAQPSSMQAQPSPPVGGSPSTAKEAKPEPKLEKDKSYVEPPLEANIPEDSFRVLPNKDKPAQM